MKGKVRENVLLMPVLLSSPVWDVCWSAGSGVAGRKNKPPRSKTGKDWAQFRVKVLRDLSEGKPIRAKFVFHTPGPKVRGNAEQIKDHD